MGERRRWLPHFGVFDPGVFVRCLPLFQGFLVVLLDELEAPGAGPAAVEQSSRAAEGRSGRRCRRVSRSEVWGERGCFIGGFGVAVSSIGAQVSASVDAVEDSALRLDDHYVFGSRKRAALGLPVVRGLVSQS